MGEGPLRYYLKIVLMVENGDFLLQELFHWVAERDSATEIFVIGERNLAVDGCPTPFSESSYQLCGDFVSCRRKQNPLEIVGQAEIGYQPLFEVKA